METTDVLVIGAGPAGSISAAKIHQAGFKVRVLEKETFPRFVIGESLLPRVMDVLDDVGLLEAVKAKGFQEKFGAKFVKGDLVADYDFGDQYTDGWKWTWQVPRAEFDTTLIQTVESMGVPVDFKSTVTDIQFAEDESSVTTYHGPDGVPHQIKARFIVDASGYGRVIPKLFNLDRPSTLPARRTVFAHVKDAHRHDFYEPNRIIIVVYKPAVWVWVIPFSNGVTSLGFVGDISFFEEIGGDLTHQFKTLIQGNEFLRNRFSDQEWVFEPRKLEGWSVSVDSFFGKGYVLTGNVTEFLDPVFSSGVMFASVSSHLAAQLVIRKLNGEEVDWNKDYSTVLQEGVEVFRSFVVGWYDGTLDKIFFAKRPDPEIRKKICSILAGYVWDKTNPFVSNHAAQLVRLSNLVSLERANS